MYFCTPVQLNIQHIVIIGAGNVGTHLARLFESRVQRVSLFSHNDSNIPSEADLFLLCIRDSALEDVASSLNVQRGMVAHTSGTVSMQVLKKFPTHGVFYPFQSFRKEIALTNQEFPILIEASDAAGEKMLQQCAALITEKVILSDEAGRKQLHIAGVFASNFTNLMYSSAYEIAGTRFDAHETLTPLLRETLDRLKFGLPNQFQTGPAMRNDAEVIQAHLTWLKTKPELRDIYEALTRALLKKYGHHELP